MRRTPPPPTPAPEDPSPVARSPWIWVVGLVVALLILGADSARRLDGIRNAADTPVGNGLAPVEDSASPTGYRWGTHRLALTQTDGYHWLLQTEAARGAGEVRVRSVDYDNAPAGREVHWAGALRWWTQGVAAAYRATHPGVTAPLALERVAPWANAALLAVFLVLVTPVAAVRFGALPAALFAVGCVTVFPFYDFFGVGYLDHHGVAAMLSLLSVLALAAGGAGWVAPEDSGRSPDAGWVPGRAAARAWFLASGIGGAAALWISAASAVPVLAAVGLGALGATWVAGQSPSAGGARFEADLFRLWGFAGAGGSMAFYLLEYAPGHVGLRLEVNHPLYALALLGAGDGLARLLARAAGPRDGSSPARGAAEAGPVGWLVADAVAVLAVPVTILATGGGAFRVADPLLWTFHDRFIVEFLDLRVWMTSLAPAQVAGQMSLVPLVGLPLAALLWPRASDGGGTATKACALGLAAASTAYAYVFLVALAGDEAVAIIGAAAVAGLGFVLPAMQGAPSLPLPLRSALVLTAAPAWVVLLMSFAQMRWIGIATALWLGVAVVTLAALIRGRHPFLRGVAGRAGAGAFALAVLGLAPALAMRGPFEPSRVDTITRDASLWLRHRVGGAPTVVLASPTATTHLTWFGGFRGVGTLYWENLEGMRASLELYGTADPDSARARLVRRGVTHVAFFAWDGGLEQLLESGQAVGEPGADDAGLLHRLEHQLRAGDVPDLPPWLVPLTYVPPRVSGYVHPVVQLLEVVEPQPPAITWARLARHYQALEDTRMESALARSLEAGPSVPGLALQAQLQRIRGDRAGFDASVGRLRAVLAGDFPVEVGDRLEAAIVFGLAGDGAAVARQLGLALGDADERQLRRLAPERLALLLDLARQGGLDRVHPEATARAARIQAGG